MGLNSDSESLLHCRQNWDGLAPSLETSAFSFSPSRGVNDITLHDKPHLIEQPTPRSCSQEQMESTTRKTSLVPGPILMIYWVLGSL